MRDEVLLCPFIKLGRERSKGLPLGCVCMSLAPRQQSHLTPAGKEQQCQHQGLYKVFEFSPLCCTQTALP